MDHETEWKSLTADTESKLVRNSDESQGQLSLNLQGGECLLTSPFEQLASEMQNIDFIVENKLEIMDQRFLNFK